jgi:hypothetical protein
MGTMMGTLRVNGDNTYKMDHFQKERRRKAKTLPVSLTCPPDVIEKGRWFLDRMENPVDLTILKKEQSEDSTSNNITNGII